MPNQAMEAAIWVISLNKWVPRGGSEWGANHILPCLYLLSSGLGAEGAW